MPSCPFHFISIRFVFLFLISSLSFSFFVTYVFYDYASHSYAWQLTNYHNKVKSMPFTSIQDTVAGAAAIPVLLLGGKRICNVLGTCTGMFIS